ncbi:MAG: glucan 1,4-alpha-glucosidase [Hyphomicrobiaceae bacterium]|nr:glucan 1,4-alpha-glucosidase [Hyphomicrobiaceae bacterium]
MFHTQQKTAPGKPGIAPTWSSSAKDYVTTSLGPSRIWATFGFGIVNEVYWPSTGYPQIRDLGFIVRTPKGWSEIKRANRYQLSTPDAAIPLPSYVHEGEGYRLELEFLPHPLRDALMIRFHLEGEGAELFALLAPHLEGARENDAWANAELTARHGNVALCLAAENGFSKTSAGFVGASDAWQDFARNGDMAWSYREALGGNVALAGKIEGTSGLLSLAFARTLEGARTLARSSLADDYEDCRRTFIDQWQAWAGSLNIPFLSPELRRAAELSAAVIKMHEDTTYAGAIVASLSVPWGSAHDDPGGYHLVWTRDTVEASLAMLAVGQIDDAARTLAYLVGTQADDGSWAQNYFPDGTGYWSGSQLDEVALPLILLAKLGAVGRQFQSLPVEQMVQRAIGYIVRNGPLSDQDRWEENAGASPFTLAVVIGALVSSAGWFSPAERDYLLGLADCWNERIERWTYAAQGPLGAGHDIDGYYVRLAPRSDSGRLSGTIDVRNVSQGPVATDRLIGTEFLYLVRMGLRSPNDKRVTDTVKLVDAMLRVETPSGPSFHRYNGDGYGEHEDGSAFDGTGIGRLWPLLTGERGHYELAAGRDARPWLDAMTEMTGPGGLIPEQIWDADPVSGHLLIPGKPSGSAMPLVWAHAEFLKLLTTMANGRPTELLAEVEARYGGKVPAASRWHWRTNSPFVSMPKGRALLIERDRPFVLHFSTDDWATTQERPAEPTYFGLHGVELAPELLRGVAKLSFTFHYVDAGTWEGRNFDVMFDSAG